MITREEKRIQARLNRKLIKQRKQCWKTQYGHRKRLGGPFKWAIFQARDIISNGVKCNNVYYLQHGVEDLEQFASLVDENGNYPWPEKNF